TSQATCWPFVHTHSARNACRLPINNHHPPIFFLLNDTATTEIYTLSLHDALPISLVPLAVRTRVPSALNAALSVRLVETATGQRSEEHTSELQSRGHLVCRLLLEKKNRRI